jgi:Protein of unknown function (DUF3108)
MKFSLLLLFLGCASAESLHYTINWPSGLSLGEATLDSSHAQGEKSSGNWTFSLEIDAGIPGFAIRDEYHAQADANLCSTSLDKKFTHGSHKNDEHISFDQSNHTATRKNTGGAKSDVSIPACGRDALSFLQFARNELAAGRLVPQQPVIFGALYETRIEFTGTQNIKVGEKAVEADHINATIKGPASDLTVEIFFSRDAARIPLMAKIPLSLGTFSVELVR